MVNPTNRPIFHQLIFAHSHDLKQTIFAYGHSSHTAEITENLAQEFDQDENRPEFPFLFCILDKGKKYRVFKLIAQMLALKEKNPVFFSTVTIGKKAFNHILTELSKYIF